MSIELIQYTGDPISNEALQQMLQLGNSYTILTATTTQEQFRKTLAPPHQIEIKDDGSRVVHLVFHKAIRYWLPKQPLRRTEERVMLLRAAQIVGGENPTMVELLRQDVPAWRRAMAELAEQGLDLKTYFPEELRQRMVNPAAADLILQLQKTYQEQQQGVSRQTFETAAFEYLCGVYQPHAVTVLDGFTFLAPLQKLLVERSDAMGAHVYLIYPYRQEQCNAYQIMDRTYRDWLQNSPVRVIQTTKSVSESDLAKLQRCFMAENMTEDATNDNSVVIRGFNHRHQEISAAVATMKGLIENGASPKDIAIINRHLGEFSNLLLEEAELQNLPVKLRIPPRQLLLTPVGRFALEAYNIWKDNQLEMKADQFETIIASGWLGATVQGTTEDFRAVKAQIFSRSLSLDDWQSSLTMLMSHRREIEENGRIPSSMISDKTIKIWSETIEELHSLCQRLFSSGQRSIGDHVKKLLDELTKFAPEVIREAERKVLEEIRAALEQLTSFTTLEVSPDEFGQVINSLVRERQDQDVDDYEEEPDGEIAVTTPEGIDGNRRGFVFYLGVDDDRAPRKYIDPWPVYELKKDEHFDIERYLFLAVIEAAQKRLYLSYARVDQGERLEPSVYLNLMEENLGFHVDEPPEALIQGNSNPIVVTESLGRARRLEYSLSEIAQFGLCPFRYKLELLDQKSRVYQDSWHMQFLAEGTWLHYIFQYLLANQSSAKGILEVKAMLEQAMDATEQKILETFPGLRPLDWHNIEEAVYEKIDYYSEHYENYRINIVEAGEPFLELSDPSSDDVIKVTTGLCYAIQKGQFLYPYLDDKLYEEWLLPSRGGGNQTISYTQAGLIRVFEGRYDAIRWWRDSMETIFYYRSSLLQQSDFAANKGRQYQALVQEVAALIEQIEMGLYPKHPGESCMYCPVYGDCLGL